ncbi:MAG: ferritin-like domain-containing protein [Thermoplasmatota archaeon]
MTITREELVEKLNNDLAWEYTACIQYIQHSGVITGAAYTSIRKEIIVHAGEELQHAITLADQISYLGGTPTVRTYEAKTSDDNVKMLQQDLDGEEDAVRRYIERISEAEKLKLFHLSQQLRNILVMEQEHAKDLAEALGK